jgi:hypothetical protein
MSAESSARGSGGRSFTVIICTNAGIITLTAFLFLVRTPRVLTPFEYND